jgi:hypothetical protein
MIAATLSGPNYFSPSHDEYSTELFDDLGAAVEALLDRYNSNGARSCHVDWLYGSSEDVTFPAFGEGTSLTLYLLPDPEPADAADPDALTEHYISEALPAIHVRAFDYTLTLEYVGDRISVTVVPG